MEFIDRPKKDIDVNVQTFLTADQVNLMKEKLQEYVESKAKYALELQLYALFSLSTMARVNAVSNIKWNQIDLEERVCNDVIEKEGYLVHGRDSSKPIACASWSKMISRIFKELGIKGKYEQKISWDVLSGCCCFPGGLLKRTGHGWAGYGRNTGIHTDRSGDRQRDDGAG